MHLQQLLAGREVAGDNAPAAQMANFMYVVGDETTRECVLVDPAWDVRGIHEAAVAAGYKPIGALVTHYHPDHVGGRIFGISIEGLADLLTLAPMKIYVNKHEADGVRKVTGVSESDLVRVEGGDTLKVGGLELTFLHTPGHTPGSQCFLVGGNLISGDTLFIEGCGRVDLPGADPDQMYESLTQKLAKLPDDTILYPGHDYADRPTSTMGDEKRKNAYLRVPSLAAWRSLMGR
jgi:glyoxylase-like metal-dependent hydrolase (beta-lactamase superfamily II)